MQEKLNGLDMSVIQNLVKEYSQFPEKANTQWSATVKWEEGFSAKVQVRDLPSVIVDEPKWLAGKDEGANPVELLLSALGSCMSIGFIATATSLGIKINSLEVEVLGAIDFLVFFGLKEGHSGFEHIDVNFKVDSDADEVQLQEIISQVSTLSPVKNTLEKNARVRTILTKEK